MPNRSDRRATLGVPAMVPLARLLLSRGLVDETFETLPVDAPRQLFQEVAEKLAAKGKSDEL